MRHSVFVVLALLTIPLSYAHGLTEDQMQLAVLHAEGLGVEGWFQIGFLAGASLLLLYLMRRSIKKAPRKKKTKDPICGMDVHPEKALSAQYKKNTYFFCSKSCKTHFTSEPKKYVKVKK